MKSRLLSFYLGSEPDGNGRMLSDIQSWDDEALERVHDYIQWLFPLPEPSKFNRSAPILTSEEIAVFHKNADLRKQLLKSLQRMLRFYGFELHEAGGIPIVSCSDTFCVANHWLTPSNHNMLRITRILRSVALLGLPQHSHAFLNCLEGLHSGSARGLIKPETMQFWRNAVTIKRSWPHRPRS